MKRTNCYLCLLAVGLMLALSVTLSAQSLALPMKSEKAPKKTEKKKAPPKKTSQPKQQTTVRPSAVKNKSSNLEAEMLFWKEVSGSKNPAFYHAYLEKYPEGLFVEIARLRIRELEAEKAIADAKQKIVEPKRDDAEKASVPTKEANKTVAPKIEPNKTVEPKDDVNKTTNPKTEADKKTIGQITNEAQKKNEVKKETSDKVTATVNNNIAKINKENPIQVEPVKETPTPSESKSNSIGKVTGKFASVAKKVADPLIPNAEPKPNKELKPDTKSVVKPETKNSNPTSLVSNNKAISHIEYNYPEARVQSSVAVEIIIDETGNVVSAKAINGPVILRQLAEQASLRAKYPPTQISNNALRMQQVSSSNSRIRTSQNSLQICQRNKNLWSKTVLLHFSLNLEQ
jgi:hypothetical protein